MNCRLIVVVVTAVVLSTVHSQSPPVFLERGSKICTLNAVGIIPNGNLKHPVYQKVCRQVIPVLGDQISDEEEDKQSRKNAPGALKDDEAAASEQVRRAIMGQLAQDEDADDDAHDDEDKDDELEVKDQI